MLKQKPLLIFLALAVIVIGLLFFARSAGKSVASFWPGTEIACIAGHQNLALHIHPTLTISVDGTTEIVPANIGISSACMAEVHTHDATGKIHIESIETGRTFTLVDFYSVWGEKLERDGYTVLVTINGEMITDLSSRTLKDADAIGVTYTSTASTTAS